MKVNLCFHILPIFLFLLREGWKVGVFGGGKNKKAFDFSGSLSLPLLQQIDIVYHVG
jgi:hypothetical protein